jgi:hypothetical protein
VPRKPTLRRKKVGKSVSWFTKAGGETYFGNVADVPFKEAKKLFTSHIKTLAEDEVASKGKVLTAGERIELLLDWLQKNRSERTYSTRRTYCSRFASFRAAGKQIADLPANHIRSSDMEAWLDHLAGQRLDPQTRRHAQTSVKPCWNWATRHPSPTPYLSPTYRPYSSVERVHVPAKALTENDLITDAEIQALFVAAEIDLDQFHRFGPKTPRAPEDNPYRGYADLLRCYYHTGARYGSSLGSNVSIWLGPPCIIRKMTDLPVTSRPGLAARAWASRSQGRDRPPRPRVPILRKSRRVCPGPPWLTLNMVASCERVMAAGRGPITCARRNTLPSGSGSPNRRAGCGWWASPRSPARRR